MFPTTVTSAGSTARYEASRKTCAADAPREHDDAHRRLTAPIAAWVRGAVRYAMRSRSGIVSTSSAEVGYRLRRSTPGPFAARAHESGARCRARTAARTPTAPAATSAFVVPSSASTNPKAPNSAALASVRRSCGTTHGTSALTTSVGASGQPRERRRPPPRPGRRRDRRRRPPPAPRPARSRPRRTSPGGSGRWTRMREHITQHGERELRAEPSGASRRCLPPIL